MNLLPSIPGIATFHESADGLMRLKVTSILATAEISLDGAHVTHFQPADGAPLLFLSRSSHFAPGKPIRGGIPICFPWFGPRAGRPDSPAHGFARIRRWTAESLAATDAGRVTAVFTLASDDETRAHWPYEFVARLTVDISRQLKVTLEVENTGTEPFEFEEALHTYFGVSDVREVTISGLEGATYLDKTDGLQSKQLGSDPLRIESETDRIFPTTEATCVIDDPWLRNQIVVEKSGSRTTVVWNPWIAKAAAMPDFGDDEWPRMLCIEAANAGTDAITLAPGERHAMSTTISVK